MEEEQKLQMINEIKRIERELYLKRSEFALLKLWNRTQVRAKD